MSLNLQREQSQGPGAATEVPLSCAQTESHILTNRRWPRNITSLLRLSGSYFGPSTRGCCVHQHDHSFSDDCKWLLFLKLFHDEQPCPVCVWSWWVWRRTGRSQGSVLPWTAAWDCHCLRTLSAPRASTDLKIYKEAVVFQKVGAGGFPGARHGLPGAGGQAGTAWYQADGSMWHPGGHSISFLSPMSASNRHSFLYPCRLFLPQDRKKKKWFYFFTFSPETITPAPGEKPLDRWL